MAILKENGVSESDFDKFLEYQIKNEQSIFTLNNKLTQQEKMVFDIQNPRIEHIKCENAPYGLTEINYVLIYRK